MADFAQSITDPLGADDALAPVYSGVVSEGGLGGTDSTSVATGGTAHTRTVTDALGGVDWTAREGTATTPQPTPEVTFPTPSRDIPLTVWARRPDGSIAGQLTAWDQLDVVVRWRDVGRWTLVTSDPSEISQFTNRKAGIVVKRGDTVVLSGPRDYMQLESRGGSTTVTLAGPDDTHVLADTQAWPNPTTGVTSQTDGADRRTGTAEALIRGYLNANRITRLGDDITLGSTSNLGKSRTYRARFVNLLELAQAVVSSDPALGFRLAQRTDRSVGLQVWLAADLTTDGPLFDGASAMTDWTYVEQAPEVTRVVVGGGEERYERRFRQVRDATGESEWGRIIEQFDDQRSIDGVARTITGITGQVDPTGEDRLADLSRLRTDSLAWTIRTSEPHGLSNGDEIRFSRRRGGKGIDLNYSYYVRDRAQRTFRLAETPGGVVVEFDRDITSAGIDVMDWATAAAEMDEAGDKILADGSPTQSLRVQVSEALGILYGLDFTVGDLVRVYPAGVRVDDRITEATLSVTREQGEVTTLWVGPKDADQDERIERRARSLRRRLGQLERAF